MGVWIFLSLILLALLLSKIRIRIIKEDVTDIYITVFHFNFRINRKKKKNHRKKSEKKHPSLLRLIPRFSKRLRKCEVSVYKIKLPCKEDEFSLDYFLQPYKTDAIVFALLSYIESNVKNLNLAKLSIVHEPGLKHICLDFSLAFRAFYLLPFLFDFIFLNLKEKI